MSKSIPLILIDRRGVGHDPRIAEKADQTVAFAIWFGFFVACLTHA